MAPSGPAERHSVLRELTRRGSERTVACVVISRFKPSREADMQSCPRRTCKFYFKNVVKCARFIVAVSEADFWPLCLHIFFPPLPDRVTMTIPVF